jgi:hypothetical protein
MHDLAIGDLPTESEMTEGKGYIEDIVRQGLEPIHCQCGELI